MSQNVTNCYINFNNHYRYLTTEDRERQVLSFSGYTLYLRVCRPFEESEGRFLFINRSY